MFLKAFTDGVSIRPTCCGKLFQLLITLELKNVPRAVVEHLGINNFNWCPRRPCHVFAVV